MQKDGEHILSTSDMTFMGRDFDYEELKDRFNTHFAKGSAYAVKISFLGHGINKSFIAGRRDGKIVIVDTELKVEYTISQFRTGLKQLEDHLDKEPVEYRE